MMPPISANQRHKRNHRCPICGGADEDPRGKERRCSGFTSHRYAHCSRHEYAGALHPNDHGMFVHFLGGDCRCGVSHGVADDPPRQQHQKQIKAVYEYRDESGTLLYEVLRLEPKGFSQRAPDGTYRVRDIRRVLYRLPELLASTGEVWLAEGEKDVETLRSLGKTATTTGGCSSWVKLANQACEVLKGRSVVICADNDEPGLQYAKQAADSLRHVCSHVAIAIPPPPHKDVSDLISGGGTLDQLTTTDVDLPKTSNSPPTVVPRSTPPGDWEAHLIKKTIGRGDNEREVVPPILANVVAVLTHHPDWAGVIGYDMFSEAIVTKRIPPWIEMPTVPRPGKWTDSDTTRVGVWLAHRVEMLNVAPRVIDQAVSVVAEKQSFHPVRDYISGLKWDGVQRLPTVLSTYFGAEDNEYTRAVGVRWFISAVARVMSPGCQADCTLILEGPQGIRKTTAFRTLVPNARWYADTGFDLGSKDSYQNLHGVWIYGLDELDSLKRGEVTRWKTYLSQTVDRYRPSYEKHSREFLRQNVFCGTTNEQDYLGDSTGGRRFWPVKVLKPIDINGIEINRSQLWAEAHSRFQCGEVWHIDTPEIRQLCEEEQVHRHTVDPWEEAISEWIKGYPLIMKNGVTIKEILVLALDKRIGDVSATADSKRVGKILRGLGLEKRRVRSCTRLECRWFLAER